MFPTTRIKWFSLALAGGFAVAGVLLGQVTTCQIRGTEMDSQGLVVASARVVVANELTGQRFEVESNALGEYIARFLPVGRYTVTVESAGFRRYARAGIALTAGEVAHVDVTLEVGPVTETVTVTAELPPVNTTTSTLDTLIDERRLVDLPLNGRNILDLASLMPGVTRASTANAPSLGQQSINVNGNRAYSTNIMLDGGSMYYGHRGAGLIPPPPDAVQELKVITSGTTSEFGRGSAVVSAVTKSGTNEFHGSLWNYLRNDALDARSFFASTVPKLRYNQFGGTLGGPIVHNKAFFFGSYQGLEVRSDKLVSSANPPTDEERAGNFANSRHGVPIDPTTGEAFPNATIPRSRMDPVSLTILDMFPAPNRPNGSYVRQVSRPQETDMVMAKVDFDFTPGDRTTVRYFIDDPGTTDPFGRGDIDTYGYYISSDRAQNIVASHIHTFSPNLVFGGRFSHTRFYYQEKPFPDDTSLADLGSNFTTGGGPPTLPRINISGRLNAYPGKLSLRRSRTWDGAGDFSWFQGKHEVKFGAAYMRQRYFPDAHGTSQGDFTFNGTFTNNALADFLLGPAARLRQEAFRRNDAHYSSVGFYVQDQWRATSRLTLTLGLRWEIYEPFRTPDGKFAALVPGARSTFVPDAPDGMVYDRDDAFPLQRDAVNIAPRIGFAYDVFGNGKTSIRGGYSVSYDPLIGQVATQNAQPFGGDLDTTNVGPLSDPQKFVRLPFGDIKFIFPIAMQNSWLGDPQTPYAQNLNFTVEQQVPLDTLVRASYVATLGRKVAMRQEQNWAVYIPGESTTKNTDQRRIYAPTYSSIFAYSTDGTSSYNALQLEVRKRFSAGYTFGVAYAFGKAIDEVSTSEVAHWDPQDPLNRRGSRGLGDHDIRQRLVLSWLWELPFLRDQSGVVGKVLGGWQFSGLGTIQDGTPFNLSAGRDNSLRGVNCDRPDVISDPKLSGGRPRSDLIAKYFDTSQLQMNQLGQYGNVGRNILIGPGSVGFDLSLHKRISVTESKAVEFRWDVFNAFNRPNFGQPRSNLAGGASFGRITSASSGRIMQLALRFEF